MYVSSATPEVKEARERHERNDLIGCHLVMAIRVNSTSYVFALSNRDVWLLSCLGVLQNQ